MKKKMYTLAVASLATLALLLTACGNSDAASSKTKTAASDETDKPLQDEAKSAVLYIGLTDHLKEVPCDCEATPDALIAALAKETGWDLTLERSVIQEEGSSMLAVAFAEDSAIYSQLPEKQKEDYRVDDTEDFIYTVLNSTAETLKQNLGMKNIIFCSPDGENLDFENDGYAFYLYTGYPWDEETVRANNEPLSEDSIGQILKDPTGETLSGWYNLTLIFKRDNVEPASGKITIYNEDGTVFSQYDATDAEHVEAFDLFEDQTEYTGWKNGTGYYIWLDKPAEAGKNYSISIDGGAFTADGLSTKEMPKEDWVITCSDYGFGESSAPGNTEIKLGEVVTQEVILGNNVERVEITVEDPEMGTISAEQLTEDGTITLTPNKAGYFMVDYEFILKDESSYLVTMNYEITP